MSKPQGDHIDWSDKMVFSTGEAAQVCKVSQQTIIRCFDDGRLQGFRVPGSKFRRIPRDSLIRFMSDNSIPVGRLESQLRRVVCIVKPGSELLELAGATLPDDRLDISIASSGFEAGWVCRDRGPHVVVIGPGLADELREAIDQNYKETAIRSPLILHVEEGESLDAVVRGMLMLLDQVEAGEHG